MQHFESKEEKQEFLGRMIKHFNKERVVAEKTLEKVKMLESKCANCYCYIELRLLGGAIVIEEACVSPVLEPRKHLLRLQPEVQVAT